MEVVLSDEQLFAQYERYVYELIKVVKEETRKSLGLICYVKDERGLRVDKSDLEQTGREILWDAIKEYPKLKAKRERENQAILEYNQKIENGEIVAEKKELKNVGSISTFIHMRLHSRLINLNAEMNLKKNNGVEVSIENIDVPLPSNLEMMADFNRVFEKMPVITKEIIHRYFTSGDTVATIKRFYPTESCQTEINKFKEKILKMEVEE